MIEIEKRFLVKELPKNLTKHKCKIVRDKIIEDKSGFPHIRVRQNGNEFEINKKYQINNNDVSQMIEESIALTKAEYDSLILAPGLMIGKTRYYYPIEDNIIEINVYEGTLTGLVIAEIEFQSEEKMNRFIKPEFLGAEVTQMKEFATGSLIHKKFEDLKELIDGLKE